MIELKLPLEDVEYLLYLLDKVEPLYKEIYLQTYL